MSGPPSPRPSTTNHPPSSSVNTDIDVSRDDTSENPKIYQDEAAQLQTSIPGYADELDEQQISLLNDTLEQSYLSQHSADAIIVQTQDPADPNGIQIQHPILPTYNATGEIDHYFSFGDFITKRGHPSFTVENVSNKISMEFNRLLSTLILSNKPIPDTLSCYFGIHHGGHWTSLVIQASINILNKSYLIQLRTFFNQLEKPYTARDYSTVVNLLSVIGGKNSPALMNEFYAQLKEIEPFHSIGEVETLISTLKKKDSDSTKQSEKWFVPFYQAAQIILMDSCNGRSNETIATPLSEIFPNVPIQKPRVPQQGPNHCGDNTIWNGFYYSTHGNTCAVHLSDSLRKLSMQVCRAEVAKKTKPVDYSQLKNTCLEKATQLLANVPLVATTREPLTPAKAKLLKSQSPVSFSPIEAQHDQVDPIIDARDKTLGSRVSIILKLEDYLNSSLHIIKVFLIAVFSLNIFGLGFRKYLMARKLKKELDRRHTNILEVDKLILQYDKYNTYLENHKPLLWLENFRSICPKNKEYDVSDCMVPENSAFYKALHNK